MAGSNPLDADHIGDSKLNNNKNDDDDDDDPIVATYGVFARPSLPAGKRLMVLQYVNMVSADPAVLRAPRLHGLRAKPGSRMVEADVGLDPLAPHFDRDRGVNWGLALSKSVEARKGGSLGLAGGFGIGAPQRGAVPRASRRDTAGGDEDDEGRGRGGAATAMSFQEAMRNDKVLRTQTFGGVSRNADEEMSKTMVGVFQGNNIHLTPVSTRVSLRPVMHHLDAAAEQDRISRMQNTPAAAAGAAPGAKDAVPTRAIHMTLKSATEGGAAAAAETMPDRLRAAQIEPWRHMALFADDTNAAWDAYLDNLLLVGSKPSEAEAAAAAAAAAVASATAPPTTTQEGKGKGKGKAVAKAGAENDNDNDDDDDEQGKDTEETEEVDTREGDAGAPGLADRVARLRTDWVEDSLLRATARIGKHDKKPSEEAASSSPSSPQQQKKQQQQQQPPNTTKLPAVVPAAARATAAAPAAPTESAAVSSASTAAAPAATAARGGRGGASGARGGGRGRGGRGASRGGRGGARGRGGALGAAPANAMQID